MVVLLIDTGFSSFSQQTDLGNTHMYANHVYTHIYSYFYIDPPVPYWANHEFKSMSPPQIQYHMLILALNVVFLKFKLLKLCEVDY